MIWMITLDSAGIISWEDIMRAFYWSIKLSRQISCMASFAGIPSSWISVDLATSSKHSHSLHHMLFMYQKLHFSSSTPRLFSCTEIALPWESPLCESPQRRLEAAMEEDCIDEAWEVFCSYKFLHGFPKQGAVKKMISLMACSSSSRWLRRAYELVLLVLDKRPDLLDSESLIQLALILSRSQMPVPASTLIRVVFEKYKVPSLDAIRTLLFHLVKSEIGSYLASDILIEICEGTLHHKPVTRKSKQLKLLNQNVTIFNLVLDSCSKYGSSLKALLIIELMSQIGVVADTNSIITFARIYEKIGQRDELMRFKVHVDRVAYMRFGRHYRQFYDSLLSLHFRYNDLDAAAELILHLYNHSKSPHHGDRLIAANNGLSKPCLLQIGSGNLRTGYKVLIDPELLGCDFIVDSRGHSGMVLFSDGKHVPSTKALAKLINGFVRDGNVVKLSNLLIRIEKEIDSKEDSLSSFVLLSCIQLGWLEITHDILDDLESAGIPIEENIYKFLLRAYCKENLFEESKVLLKQMRKMGLFVKLSDEDAVRSCLSGDSTIKSFYLKGDFAEDKSCLARHLDREIREGDLECPMFYEFNSTILFFCKANMMEDAISTVKRMQQRNILPTVHTFSYLLNGYSSLKMYRQITILWGDVKRRLEDGILSVDRDLFDCFLMNFLRGGYFERVMEIANYMIRHNMYADKWKYKKEFIKFHEDLYRNLKPEHTETDAQRKRVEHVQAFRKWVGIDKMAEKIQL